MIDATQAFWLALIQGLTEFLPISSSAHLILPSALLGWQDQGLAFDVAVHLGSLLAVVSYFRRDIGLLGRSWLQSMQDQRLQTPESRMVWYLIAATLPACIVGLVADQLIETHLRTLGVIAATTLVFGLLLGWADLRHRGDKILDNMTLKAALLIGLAQILALIPGTSRSGITITAALALGFERQAAARFSFLLAIPIIALSGGYKALQLLSTPAVDWLILAIGAAVSTITAYLCIHGFLRLVNRLGMLPFVIYRLLLGLVLILIINGQL